MSCRICAFACARVCVCVRLFVRAAVRGRVYVLQVAAAWIAWFTILVEPCVEVIHHVHTRARKLGVLAL